MTTTDAIAVLSRFALEHVGELEAEAQIEIYWALGLTLPDPVSRNTANQLAIQQSEIAALQLDLHLAMTSDKTKA